MYVLRKRYRVTLLDFLKIVFSEWSIGKEGANEVRELPFLKHMQLSSSEPCHDLCKGQLKYICQQLKFFP